MSTAIILGASNDYHAFHVMQACQQKGLRALLFDTALYPSRVGLSWKPGDTTGSLNISGEQIPYGEVQSVFWSSLSPVNCPVSHPGQLQIARNDSMSMLRTFLQYEGINWVNSWRVFQSHQVKPLQLTVAQECGATLPQSYIGNDPIVALDFIQRNKQCIFKPVYGGAHATVVSASHTRLSHLSKVFCLSPVTLQQQIAGTDVRTFVIGEQVFSAEIKTAQSDFRLDKDARHRAIETPPDIAALASRIMLALGMRWTAIDWRRTDDGEYFFLEANPSPMFIHFEQLTGFEITDALVDLLLEERPQVHMREWQAREISSLAPAHSHA